MKAFKYLLPSAMVALYEPVVRLIEALINERLEFTEARKRREVEHLHHRTQTVLREGGLRSVLHAEQYSLNRARISADGLGLSGTEKRQLAESSLLVELDVQGVEATFFQVGDTIEAIVFEQFNRDRKRESAKPQPDATPLRLPMPTARDAGHDKLYWNAWEVGYQYGYQAGKMAQGK
jgi:hypothetical protein